MATRVVIVGAGGHGTVVADILRCASDGGDAIEALAFVDDNWSRAGEVVLGLPVFGGLATLESLSHDAAIVAIGDNRARREIFERLRSTGKEFARAIHPRAVIARDVPVGDGAMVCANVVVNPASRIGDNAILNTGSTIDHHNVIGAHAHVAPGAHLGGNVAVGEGALVGIGAIVLPGKRIGAWAVVGAGAVVTDDVPDGCTVVGCPAKPLKKLTRV